MIKVCSKCGTEKPLEDFYRNVARRGGRSYQCKECELSAKKERYSPEENANIKLKSNYGITLEDYDRMLEDQGGCCKVCGTSEPGSGKGRFAVDHNHNTGKIRGLLCSHCNTGLGKFKDSPDLLEAAKEYLLEEGYYGA